MPLLLAPLKPRLWRNDMKDTQWQWHLGPFKDWDWCQGAAGHLLHFLYLFLFFSFLSNVCHPFYSIFLPLFLCSISCEAEPGCPIGYRRAPEFPKLLRWAVKSFQCSPAAKMSQVALMLHEWWLWKLWKAMRILFLKIKKLDNINPYFRPYL